jgi:hypothetical protein
MDLCNDYRFPPEVYDLLDYRLQITRVLHQSPSEIAIQMIALKKVKAARITAAIASAYEYRLCFLIITDDAPNSSFRGSSMKYLINYQSGMDSSADFLANRFVLHDFPGRGRGSVRPGMNFVAISDWFYASFSSWNQFPT